MFAAFLPIAEKAPLEADEECEPIPRCSPVVQSSQRQGAKRYSNSLMSQPHDRTLAEQFIYLLSISRSSALTFRASMLK